MRSHIVGFHAPYTPGIMPMLIVVATIQPHDWYGARGERVDVACDGIRRIIFIKLQGTSNDDSMILSIVAIIVTLIKYCHATIAILNVGVRIGVECRKHVLDEEGAPSFIPYGIANGDRITIDCLCVLTHV